MVDDESVHCYAGAALERWRDENPKTEPGAQVFVRRLTDEERAYRRDG